MFSLFYLDSSWGSKWTKMSSVHKNICLDCTVFIQGWRRKRKKGQNSQFIHLEILNREVFTVSSHKLHNHIQDLSQILLDILIITSWSRTFDSGGSTVHSWAFYFPKRLMKTNIWDTVSDEGRIYLWGFIKRCSAEVCQRIRSGFDAHQTDRISSQRLFESTEVKLVLWVIKS